MLRAFGTIALFVSAIVLVAVSNQVVAQTATAEAGFVSLFNGENLDGWQRHGGKAEYHIEGDAIVGTSKANTPNTFLCTEKEYSDFVLEVDLKVADGLNSGIQIRSHVFDEPHEYEYKQEDGGTRKIKVSPGRVHGYQVEIDPSDRAYSGGIYDEARRAWLNDLSGDENKAAREAFKRGEWNHYRIEAVGNTIKTWVNGVAAANLTDDQHDAAGLIALQVHSVGQGDVGKQVRWRNIMIKELGQAE